jgi:hypothetical protein
LPASCDAAEAHLELIHVLRILKFSLTMDIGLAVEFMAAVYYLRRHVGADLGCGRFHTLRQIFENPILVTCGRSPAPN